jgi:hypothetical protein
MRKRINVGAALTGLALTAVLCGCASTTQTSASAGASTSASATSVPSAATSPAAPAAPGASSSPARSGGPAAGAPIIFAVRLDHGFSPSTLRLSPGQHFVVTVASSVKAGGMLSSCSSNTADVDNGMLSVHCTSGTYYYTAERAGTVVLTASVRPDCSGGGMCPQWIAVATLKITIL